MDVDGLKQRASAHAARLAAIAVGPRGRHGRAGCLWRSLPQRQAAAHLRLIGTGPGAHPVGASDDSRSSAKPCDTQLKRPQSERFEVFSAVKLSFRAGRRHRLLDAALPAARGLLRIVSCHLFRGIYGPS